MTRSDDTTNLLALLSRVFIWMLFIPFGIGKLTGWEDTLKYIASANVPYPQVAATIGAIVELGLSTLLLLGYKTRWVALAIVVYVLVLAFVFHPYWAVPAAQVFAQKTNFFKNMGIAGGLFAIAAWGPGAWSLDARTGTA